MKFLDWRTADVSAVNIQLDQNKIYAFSARAVGLKGYLGGSHTWIGFWCRKQLNWLVVELTDLESLQIQKAVPVFQRTSEFLKLDPFISIRDPRGKWFGARPVVIDELSAQLQIDELIEICKLYPFDEYKLLSQNCNTFFSYLSFKIKLTHGHSLKKPKVIVGYKSTSQWENTLTSFSIAFKPRRQPYYSQPESVQV